MNRLHPVNLLAFLALAFHAALIHAADSRAILGHWKGLTLVKPGEYEVETEVDFSQGAQGGPVGKLSFTTNGQFDMPVNSLAVEGSHAQFAVTDEGGVVSSFQGWLAEDGASIKGDLEESGAHYVFNLVRANPHEGAAAPPSLLHLTGSGEELKARFNKDVSSVRLLAILSASCPLCKSGLGVIQRTVLDEIKDPKLQVYVVWEPVLTNDKEESAAAASRFASDPRVVQYWGGDRFTGRAFAKILGTGATPAWDVYFVFPAGVRWEGPAPDPAFVMSNMPGDQPVKKYPRLNGPTLTTRLKSLLAPEASASSGRSSH